MTESLILKQANVNAQLVGASKAVKAHVSHLLSFMVEGAEHSTTFKSSGWDGRSSFFSMKDCTFPAGFTHMVYSELTRLGHQVRLVRKALPEPRGPVDPKVDEFGNDDPRYDFQPKAVRQVEKHGRGIIQVATGGGKSKISKLITARYRRMTLFLTTRGVLLYQMADAFEKDCKFNVGIIGDGEWNPVKGVNCAMVQTLVANLQVPAFDVERRAVIQAAAKKYQKLSNEDADKLATERFNKKLRIRNRTLKFLEMVEVVIGEEAHEAGGNSYFEILRHCKGAQIRVALTATPFMRDDAEDNMRLMAAFGPILIKVSEKTLIDRGILAKPFFKFVASKPHDKLRKSSPWQRAYQLGYTENPYMLDDILRDAKMAQVHGLPVMTLIMRKEHGDRIKAAMGQIGLRAEFIRGENDQKARKTALTKLAQGKIDVLIGTTILDVGVDVPAVGLVQLAGGGKAEVATRQRIGRGLRAKKGMPNFAFIADYTTGPNTYLRDHAFQRRSIIEQTPGFKEGILPANDDFPWHLFKNTAQSA
jgi:superfamily II DNA or RNA helicase